VIPRGRVHFFKDILTAANKAVYKQGRKIMINRKWFLNIAAAALALTLALGACDLPGEEENEPNASVQYTVTYNANGGRGTSPSAQTADRGTAITLAGGSGLTKDGYIFSGWNTSADGTGTTYAAGASFTVTAHITFYAKWIPASDVQYTVTYDVNGGSGTAPLAQTANRGVMITLADGSGLTKEGYTFSGWNTGADGAGTSYAAGASFLVAADITLYAAWIPASGVQYTVTYDVNGGSGTAPLAQTANRGTAIILADGSGLTKGGYTFSGWNTGADGAGTSYAAGASFTVTADITLYAKWTPDTAAEYTVTYNVNGGDGTAPSAQTANRGTAIILADGSGLTKEGHTFSGWNSSADGAGTSYAAGASFTVTADITLYAKWSIPAAVPASSLQEALDWLDSNAESGGVYTITASADETIAPRILSYSNKTVSIILVGGNTERRISVSPNGSVFTVESGVTLSLGNNLTLQGRSSNTTSLVKVNSGGTLVMEIGSKITGNTSSSYGGGVAVSSGGTFTMSGGEISNNSSYSGGGVYMAGSGTFTMSGGAISSNTSYRGGGVYVDSSGTFRMSGGEISNNSSSSSGGGVAVSSDGTFTMNDGEISGNTSSSSSGGGVYVAGTFTMNDGEISGNRASSSSGGGGVYVVGTFTMNDGEISGNRASSYGGGVYVAGSGTFTMSGGAISSNTSYRGGGVYVASSAAFIKQSGGIIYGLDADSGLKNTASSGNGNAVYVDDSPAKQRNNTVGVGVTLDSGLSGSAGGWEE
jgi:uncharacterized repeat protein (TIGR02543 family)